MVAAMVVVLMITMTTTMMRNVVMTVLLVVTFWWCDGDGDIDDDSKGEYTYDKMLMVRKMIIAVEFHRYVGG